jgi:hypothetical protein
MIGRNAWDPTSPGAMPHIISLGPQPTLLPGPAQIHLSVHHHYRVVQPASGRPWRTSTAAYLYALHDEHGRENIAYHWHPSLAGQDRIAYPHLHVGPGAVNFALLDAAQRSRQHNALRPEFHRLHLPTRRIALEEVIRLTIEQFHAVPAHSRWDDVLQQGTTRFEATRTWL